MRLDELDQYLSDPAKFERFNTAFGPHQKQWYLDHFARNRQLVEGEWARFCGLLTEQERTTQTAFDVAEAAKASAVHAAEGNKIAREANAIAARSDKKAGLALVVSILAFVVTLAGVLVSWFARAK